MDHYSENTLKLLQDIKELLLGIALLLLAWLTSGDVFLLLLVAGLIIILYGGVHIWHGWTAHEVVEHQEETPNTQP